MRLRNSTDYGLRILIFLAATKERFVPSREIAEAYALSVDHVIKITKELTTRGWLEGRRGAGGGVRLAVDPSTLTVGAVVRALEEMQLVECFAPDSNQCKLDSACRLKGALYEARAAFLAVLDGYDLASLLSAEEVQRLLSLDR